MSRIKHFSSIKTTKEFNRVYGNSKALHTSEFVLFYHPHSEEYKLGVVASKRVGNAVSRNRAKRLLKSLFTSHIDNLKSGHYILVAKPLILKGEYKRLQKSFFKGLKRLNTLKQ